MENNDFNIKQLNEKYLFNLKQEEDKLLDNLNKSINFVKFKLQEYKNLPEYIISRNKTNLECHIRECNTYFLGTGFTDSLIDRIKMLLEFKMQQDPLYFSFGKYKGRIVQDIITTNKKYCEWFSDNVIGKDFNTLKILDYIHKTLINHTKRYTDKDKRQVLQDILDTYIPKDWHQAIDTAEILEVKKYNYLNINSASYMTPWEEEMSEIWDYGDFC